MAFVKLADNYTDLIGKFAVALLAEGVDRNSCTSLRCSSTKRSPSSRRAWIEIGKCNPYPRCRCKRRPPRGGRG